MNVIVFDTETTNTLDDPFVYDIGWAVVNLESGAVLKTASYAVAEIFLDKEIMASAYFADKIPQYENELRMGSRKLARLHTIKESLRMDCVKYDVCYLVAHNCNFDYRSCTTTQRYITTSKYRYFFQSGMVFIDTLRLARHVFNHNNDYTQFCIDNNYITAKGKPRLTAEVLYRFLTNDVTFNEEHKGLDDVLIEKEILLECLRRGANIEEGMLW